MNQECANHGMHVLTENASHSGNRQVNSEVMQDPLIKISNQKKDRKELQEEECTCTKSSRIARYTS